MALFRVGNPEPAANLEQNDRGCGVRYCFEMARWRNLEVIYSVSTDFKKNEEYEHYSPNNYDGNLPIFDRNDRNDTVQSWNWMDFLPRHESEWSR